MTTSDQFKELHWLMHILQTIDVGLVVVDKNYDLQLWNGFMANHTGVASRDVIGKNIFTSFPDFPEKWFRKKADMVFSLKTNAFTTWEQRPYIVPVKNYRPVTGTTPYMFQNSTFIPLESATGSVEHVCVIIYDQTEVAVNRKNLAKVNLELESLSQTDRLTGLFNRGHWESLLVKEFKRLKRNPGRAASLIIFDIDHFKKVNDGFGHQAGDEVIRQTATVLLDCCRDIDNAGRYGGEEFTLLLPDTDLQGALIVAERLREQIEALKVSYQGQVIPFTISLGVREFREDLHSHEQWLEESDKGLYQAKKGGRNRVEVYKA